MPFDRSRFNDNGLTGRIQKSYEKRDDTGQFKSIFVDDPILKFWKPTSAEHIIDIIPYFAGSNDPELKEGEQTHVLIIFVHYDVGVNKDAFVCPARNYNQPCPICEYREDLRREEDYDEELVKSLNPKKRSIYNVVVLDSPKEEAKGVQVFDVAHWYMEKHLSALAKVPDRNAGGRAGAANRYVPFSSLDHGMSVAFEKKGSKRNTEYIGHKFVERGYSISDEVASQAIPLDNYVVISSYEELKEAFYGSEGTMAPEEEAVHETSAPTLRTRRAEPKPAPEEEPPPPEEHPEPTLKPRARPQPAGTGVVYECPAGGKFGEDCEKLEACNGCDLWEPCSAAADKIAAEQAGAEPTPAPTPRPAPRPVPRSTEERAAPTPRPAPRPAPRPTPSQAGSPGSGPRRLPPKR